MPRCRDKYKTTHPSLCEPPPGAPQHPRSRPRSVPRPQYLRLCDGGAAEGDPVLLHPRHQVGVNSRKTLTNVDLEFSRKVLRLSLERCDLRSVNFVILATAIGCVQRANLSEVMSLCIFTFTLTVYTSFLQTVLVPDQVMEILKRCLASKTLKYFRIDGVHVPEDLNKDAEGKDMISKLSYQFNISVIEGVFRS